MSSSITVFQDDDEETWKILASASAGVDASVDLGQRLSSLAERFEEDCATSSGDFWEDTVKSLHSYGFRYSKRAAASTVPLAASTPSTKPPVAFESDEGKAHLQATKAVLGISEQRAIQVTLSALRTLETDGSQFQSLLGTSDLLLKALLHHHEQRFARLGVLTECLRVEQDPDSPCRQEVQKFLNSIDETFKDEERYRGLLQRLLSIACSPITSLSRVQLESAKSLHDKRIGISSGSQETWGVFYATLLEAMQAQQVRERTEAMEALLILLYERIDGGVRRPDYALILIAFQQAFQFFTMDSRIQQQPRLSHLAGLICAECTALWRTLDAENKSWASEHPLLLQLVSSSNPEHAVEEIDLLQALISDCNLKVLQMGAVRMSPLSLPMLSVGLLLRLASTSLKEISPDSGAESPWSSFEAKGLEMATAANDQFDAFGCLFTALDFLTQDAPSKKSSAAHDRLYDWQFSHKEHTLLLEEESGTIADTMLDATAYRSIAREVLAASITTFQSVILAIDQSNSCENIGNLANLCSAVFQNNPLLCEQFWVDWEAYLASEPDNVAGDFSICKLLDAAHRLAVAGLSAYLQTQVPRTFFVRAVAPFFQMLSSLSHNHAIIESTLRLLPEGLVREAIQSCRLSLSEASAADEAYDKCRTLLLTSFAKLAQVGNSQACLQCLRDSLEDPQNPSYVDGPRILTRLITEGEDSKAIAQSTLAIIAHLLDGAPQRWAVKLTQALVESPGAASLTRFLSLERNTTHAAALVTAELIEHMTAVIFSHDCKADEAMIFLRCITESLSSAAQTLASSISISRGQPAFSYDTAQTIMQSMSNFLKLIRSVISLHPSDIVRATGLEVRDVIIQDLSSSTGLGQVIAYYATAPVSLTLAIRLETALHDRSLLEKVSEDLSYDVDKARKFGAWQSMLTPHQNNPVEHLAQTVLRESITKMKAEDINLDGIALRKWSNAPDAAAPLNTAWTAIRLLSVWASHVEDILSTRVDDLAAKKLPLTGELRDYVESLSPYRVLASLATAPIPCRENNTASSVWEAAGLSNFELLQPYLSSPTESTLTHAAIPTTPALDLIQVCLAHVRSMAHPKTVADSPLFRLVYRSSHFSKLLWENIHKAIQASEKSTGLSGADQEDLHNGSLSLSVLASCVEANTIVADAMLHPEGKCIIPELIGASRAVKDIVAAKQEATFESESAIIKLRLATGSVAVLAALWQKLAYFSSSQKQSTGKRLLEAVETHSSFIADLVSTVSSYAVSSEFEKKYTPTAYARYAHSHLTNYMALALDLLASEVARETTEAGTALENFLLRDFVRSDRFISFTGYDLALSLCHDPVNSILNSEGNLFSLLRCFPASSKSNLGTTYFIGDSSFDVSSASFWLKSMSSEIENVNVFLSELSSSASLMSSELRAANAWKRLSEMTHLFLTPSSEEGMSIERLRHSSEEALQSLTNSLELMRKSDPAVSRYLVSEGRRMIGALSDLIVFFLEASATVRNAAARLTPSALVKMASNLAQCSDIVLSINISSTGGNVDVVDGTLLLNFERSLLSSSVIVLPMITAESRKLNAMQLQDIGNTYKTLCRVACRTIQLVWSLRKAKSIPSDSKIIQQSTLCCISVLTMLLTEPAVAKLNERAFYESLASIMSEHSVCQEVLHQTLQSCALTAERSATNSQHALKRANKASFILIESVLSFLFAIARVGNSSLLAILPEAQIAQLIVRNPLFGLLAASTEGVPRGYCILESPRIDLSSSFQPVDNDPVHLIWRMSIRVLTACLKVPSALQNKNSVVAMAIEFLQLYRDSIMQMLQSCASKFTRNLLLEVNCMLGLIAETCQKDTRHYLQCRHPELITEFQALSGAVVASMSRFLGSSGTARELLDSISHFESADGDFDPDSPLLAGIRHPLMEEGVASAKHEAVKFSHLASRCYKRVTQDDFKGSSATVPRFAAIAKGRETDTDLERTSRLSTTNNLSASVEKEAAHCVEQAIAILWRTHPIQFAYRSISDAEVQNIDCMSIIRVGMTIAFHTVGGHRSLVNRTQESTYPSLKFGTVVFSDTVSRSWKVEVLGKGDANEDNKTTCEVRAGQLAGYEDPNIRRSITRYAPAPNSMAELESIGDKLELGHLILILRWCHQESLFSCSQGLDDGCTPSLYVKRLAERVTALFGAELAIHGAQGGQRGLPAKTISTLNSQVFELFASTSSLQEENMNPIALRKEGRMKDVINEDSWNTIKPQVQANLQGFVAAKREVEKQRREKRSYSNDSPWFSGVRRSSYSQKSAFRGFR